MDKEWLFDNIKKILAKMRTISAGTVLLIWVLAMLAGVLIYKLTSGNKRAKEVTLVFATWWEDELEGGTLAALAAEYERNNQGITLKLEKMNWEEIRELLERKTQKETGKNTQKPDPLDIFSVDPYTIHELENKSILASLENDKDFSGNAVPVISFINPLYYNIDLLEKAGFDRPPKNQTEFLSYVQRLKETGTFGAGLALGDPRNVSQQLLSWVWAAGGNSAPSSFNFTSKEVIDTFKFLNQLNQNLYANPFDISSTELREAFGKGRIGMMIGSISDVKELKKTNINFSITTIPAPESYTKKPVFPLTVWYAGINKNSEYQEEAKDFLLFLKTKSEYIAAAAYAVPGSGTLNRELSKNDPYYAKAFDMYEAAEMVRELYNSPYIGQLNIIINREVRLMFQGSKTPEQCAQSIQNEWERLAGTAPAVH